ncbi:MAG: DHA3 family macrolide efflux protein-like MFS transporter [Sphingobacteriales bacterium]|jgi:DHA3 family macrolide efflux protein-like MFS transporter
MNNAANLRLLLLANAVSQFAQGISMIAIPWYFINQLNEGSFFNALFFGVTALTLFWSPYAGALIDRFHRKNLFLGLCGAGAIVLLSIAFLGFKEGATPLLGICIIFGFTVLNYNLHYPALYALAQEMTTHDGSTKTNALLEIQGQATNMISGSVAAILITGTTGGLAWLAPYFDFEPWPLHYIFLMDGITYIIAIGLLVFIRHTALHESKQDEVDKGSVWKRIKIGVKFLKDHPRLFRYGMFSYFVFVTVMIHVFYLIHLYVSDVLLASALVLAIAQVCHTAGALSAGIFTRKWLSKKRIINTKKLMITVACIYLVFFIAPSPIALAIGCLLIGFSNSAIRILRVSYLFDHVPHLKMGRVASVFQSGNILLRLVLIGCFYLEFFQENPGYTYLTNCAFILIALIPIWKMREKRNGT